MFVRKLRIEYTGPDGSPALCPVHWIDNFAMRNFTNDAIFDDTLPIADGLLAARNPLPLPPLRATKEDWFRRKGYLLPAEALHITELAAR